MGTMGMQRIFVSPSSVPAGQVSFLALNTGLLNHELVVVPLAQGQFPGQRAVGPDGKVDKGGSMGEASRTCGADKGDEQSNNPGIASGTTGWTTITLPPGGDEWLAPSPSPPWPAVPDRHDEHGVGTFIWPPVGTSTWPPVGLFHGHGQPGHPGTTIYAWCWRPGPHILNGALDLLSLRFAQLHRVFYRHF
jgi:hypothetical protein